MLDINVPASAANPATWQYEHLATCGQCSKVSYNLMMTRLMAHQLAVVGVRCGFCGRGVVVIEELVGGLNRKTA